RAQLIPKKVSYFVKAYFLTKKSCCDVRFLVVFFCHFRIIAVCVFSLVGATSCLPSLHFANYLTLRRSRNEGSCSGASPAGKKNPYTLFVLIVILHARTARRCPPPQESGRRVHCTDVDIDDDIHSHTHIVT
ncbi:uncharacterized protein NESG_02476, partial [Nematocida ausubeli]